MFDVLASNAKVNIPISIAWHPCALRSVAREPKAVYGLRPFPKRGGIVTNDLIDKLRDEDAY
jgi:hypothetical protein